LKNFDLSDQVERFDLVNISNSQFLFGEKWHFWPWTYPGKKFLISYNNINDHSFFVNLAKVSLAYP
jgi:hypothetical protein